MSELFVLPLEACEDPTQVGGKAAGLGRLLRHGFRVPPGFCLTVAAYRDALRESGIDSGTQWQEIRSADDSSRETLLKACRRRMATIPITHVMRWISEPMLQLVERKRGQATFSCLASVWSYDP